MKRPKQRTGVTDDGTKIPLYERTKTGQMVPCSGEAHSNPYIDNCTTCMPRWGQVEELAPTSFDDARARGLAVPLPSLTCEEHERAQSLVASGIATMIHVREKRPGCESWFYVLSWATSEGDRR